MIYHVSLKVIYLLAAKVEYTAIARGCTHLVWMKNMLKDYDVLEEVLTHHYDNLKGIGIFTQGLDVTRYGSLNHTRGFSSCDFFSLKKSNKKDEGNQKHLWRLALKNRCNY